MGVFIILVILFPVLAFIANAFGRLEGRLQQRTARTIRFQGRISIVYGPMIWIGIVLSIASITRSDWEGFRNAGLFIFGTLVFQASWTFCELGIIQGHRKNHEPDQDIPSVYERELKLGWVKILMPWRWLVLRLMKKQICLH